MKYSLLILSAGFLFFSILSANISLLLQASLFVLGTGLFILGLIDVDL